MVLCLHDRGLWFPGRMQNAAPDCILKAETHQIVLTKKNTIMVDVIAEKNFSHAIRRGVTLVDFNAPWCAPCHAQEPILSNIAEQFEGKASVVAVNIDSSRKTAQDLNIRSIPTLIIYKNGKEMQRFVGLQSETVLSDALDSVLA